MAETVRNRSYLQGFSGQAGKSQSTHQTALAQRIQTYGREDRLKSRKRIETLFREGKRIHANPLTVIYRFHQENPGPVLQAGVTARAKQFRLAVDRNRIKRLLREAYRLQKQPLRDRVLQGRESLDLFILFTGKAMPAYPEIFSSMGEALRKIIEKYDPAS